MHEGLFDFPWHDSILSRNLKHPTKNFRSRALGPPYQGSSSTLLRLSDCPNSRLFHSKTSEHSNQQQTLVGVPIFHTETQQSSEDFWQSLVTDPISVNRDEISCASSSSMSTQSLRKASKRVSLLSNMLKLLNSTRLMGPRMKTRSHLSLEHRSLRRFSLSRQSLQQFSVSWRLALFQTLSFPSLLAWYPVGKRHPHLPEVQLDMLSFLSLGSIHSWLIWISTAMCSWNFCFVTFSLSCQLFLRVESIT